MSRPIDFVFSDELGDATTWTCAAGVPEDLAYFDGHFDELAVLAGVAQLEALVSVGAERAWPELGHLVRFSRVKFRQMIKPGDTLALKLVRDGNKARFTIHRGEQLCTEGKFEFA